jgi:diadenylate cyclase
MIKGYLSGIFIPQIRVIDVIEILIIAFLLYLFMNWIKRTRAYTLLKGILIVVVFIIIAVIFQMSTILWIVSRLASVALLALVVIFQPELRKALESLGNKNFLATLFPFDPGQDKDNLFSDHTISEIVRAVTEMSEVKTGALIVIEQKIILTEYVETGIELDSRVTSQLLVNIFEKNTPLHDGAVILRGDRILSATCYLPISENVTISKKFGTRHRAGLGISEVSDSFTIIVSEETGRISYAYEGILTTGVTVSDLREKLHRLQKQKMHDRKKKLKIWKGRGENEKDSAE